MLENFALVIEAEDVDSGDLLTKQVQVTHVDKTQYAVDGDAFHLAGNAASLFEKSHDTVNAIPDQRIVLNVRPGYERRIQIGPPLIEDLVVDDVKRVSDVISCHDSAFEFRSRC